MADSQKKEPKKPTGLTGPVQASFAGAQPRAIFEPLDFPNSKSAIESLVAECFLRIAARERLLSFVLNSVAKNPTDDYDFTLETSEGRRYLELLEVAPASAMSAGYQQAPSSFKPYELAQVIRDCVMAKSARYDVATAPRTTLLLYETHWKFIPSQETLALLQYFTSQSGPRFDEIYWYHPIAKDDGIVEFVYPSPAEHWRGFDPELWRDAVVHNFDPRGWRPGKD